MAASPSRRWWFRLTAMVGVPLMLLLCGEGALRLAGFGYSPHLFRKDTREGHAVWSDNQDFGRRFFPPGLVRRPQPLTLPSPKALNTLRVFVLGESAAMGDPDFKFGLPRMLEVLLRERFPNRRTEIVNAGMVAINSHVILPIARDCGRKEGDVWVIYMGNNEMVGPFGSASVFGTKAPSLSLVRTGLLVKETRLGQFLDATMQALRRGNRPLPEWSGMEMMAEQKVRHDAPATTRVYQNFERNLADILATGTRAGVPIVLCTVGSNLKDCAPFASLHRAGVTPTELAEWQGAYDTGADAQGKGDAAGAKAAFERAARIDREYADLMFRLGQCCKALGREAEAAKFYRQARDKDALQFRADGQLNESIRRAAAEHAAQGVRLVDAEALFATNSPQGLTGEEFFYEHVHLTPEGNYLLAHAVAEQVTASLKDGGAGSGTWVSQEECLRLLGLTGWSRYDALNTIIDRMQVAPFTRQIDHARDLQRLNEQLARYRQSTKPAQVKREAAQVAPLVARHPEDPDLRWNLAGLLDKAGDAAGAEEQWRALMRLQPQASLPVFNLARLLDRPGRETEALALYGECLRLNPDYFPARYALGGLCLRTEKVKEAIRELRVAVREKPQSIEARLAFGQALARAQQRENAERQFREILRLDPNNASAQAQLNLLRN